MDAEVILRNQIQTLLDSWTLKMGPIGCPEKSARSCHHSLRNNPEERCSHLVRGGSLKSRFLQAYSKLNDRRTVSLHKPRTAVSNLWDSLIKPAAICATEGRWRSRLASRAVSYRFVGTGHEWSKQVWYSPWNKTHWPLTKKAGRFFETSVSGHGQLHRRVRSVSHAAEMTVPQSDKKRRRRNSCQCETQGRTMSSLVARRLKRRDPQRNSVTDKCVLPLLLESGTVRFSRPVNYRAKVRFCPALSDFRKTTALWRFPDFARSSFSWRHHVDEDENGALVEWYWQGNTEVLGEKSAAVPLCLPQISCVLAWDRTWVSAVRGRRLTASVIQDFRLNRTIYKYRARTAQ